MSAPVSNTLAGYAEGVSQKDITMNSGWTPGPWVLKATYRSGPHEGQPMYFREWTGIGPSATPDLAEAARFATQQEACQSPAFSHWSSFYEPFEANPNREEG